MSLGALPTGLGTGAQRRLDLVARKGGPSMAAAEPEVFAALQARLDTLLDDAKPVRILNAGCGRGGRYVPVARAPIVVGIDIDGGAGDTDGRFDEHLVGDLETYDFGPRRFEVVYCWNVLEHLGDPRRALVNLISTLEPGGLVVLGAPHAASVKGLITRFTPHWFHEWIWRAVLAPRRGAAAASTGGAAGPFPTVLSRAMTPGALWAFARERALSVEFYREYEAWPQKKIRARLRVMGAAFSAVCRIVRSLSFGRVTASATDVVIVLRKAGAPPR
jgi:SAM-dependent methyltransferase